MRTRVLIAAAVAAWVGVPTAGAASKPTPKPLPGVSGVAQYVETVPTATGGAVSGKKVRQHVTTTHTATNPSPSSVDTTPSPTTVDVPTTNPVTTTPVTTTKLRSATTTTSRTSSPPRADRRQRSSNPVAAAASGDGGSSWGVGTIAGIAAGLVLLAAAVAITARRRFGRS